MKSAIFQDSGLAAQQRPPRKQLPKKWPRSSSPFVVPASASASPNWNLDEILASYTASGKLPPPLSPTLPPRYAAQQTPEQGPTRDTGSDDDVDTDSVPLSLLSPTLPSVFNDTPSRHSNAALAHPLPEKPSTVQSILSSSTNVVKTNNKNKVRYVNRLDDASKPRFLLRIHFSSSKNAYRKIRPKQTSELDSSAEVKGLAISGIKPEPENGHKHENEHEHEHEKQHNHQQFQVKVQAPESQWPKNHKDFLLRFTKSSKEDNLLSIFAQFDWIICSAIMCDTATAHKQQSAGFNGKSWTGFLDEIPVFVHRIERFIKSSNASDKKRSYLSFLVGILAVCKALVLKRANNCFLTTIDDLTRKASPAQKIIDMQQQIIKNHQLMEEYYAESQSFFKNSPSPSTVCPKTWASRAQSMPKLLDSAINPTSDPYFLPLGPYSDLSEACAFLYGCLREFGDVFDIELHNGGRYHLQCGKNTKHSYD